jgi:UDP-4-amino-4,6-dideoxy-N-acetyl-beta-L-altrosamine transaminase
VSGSDDPLPFLPYGRQHIDDDDIAAVSAVLRGDWLTTGPAVDAFEAALADKVGARHAVACANGTAALHLAAMALDLGPGDRVIVPTMTFLATANAARYVGAEVVFADVDPETGLMGPDHLEAALAQGPARAVFPVHLNGQCADMAAIAAVARDHGLAVVEDACHVLGGSQAADGGVRPVGACAHSNMAVFSLHPVKVMTMGEGGVVTTNDDATAARLKRLRSHGMERDPARFTEADQAFDGAGNANPWYYEMAEPGYNYRATDIHCALGLSQLGKLDRFVTRRGALMALYDDLLAPLAPAVVPITRTGTGKPAWHLCAVRIDFAGLGIERSELVRRLHEQGIGTQVHYLPVHRQPYYRARYGGLALPGADAYYDRCLSLPLYYGMSDDDIRRTVTALRNSLPNT